MKMSMIVRLKYALLLIVLVASSNLSAQNEKSLLWKISGNDLEQPSYLFGTIHIICADDALITDAMKSAFASTKKLVLELNMQDQSEMASAAQMMLAPGGIDYKGKLSEQAYAKLDSLMKLSFGVGMQVGSMMKPIGLMAAAYKSLVTCEETTAMEEEFLALMEGTDMTTAGLETMAFQMSIFNDIPVDEQIDWLEDMLGDSADAQDEFAKMIDAYKAQDITGLFNLFKESPEYAQYEDKLLTERNKNWIPKMSEMMNEQPTFFAVGAGHLGGDIGVIKLLKEAGYTVEAVENK